MTLPATMLPRWACLTRVWLEGFDAGCDGRMGWVVAVSDCVSYHSHAGQAQALVEWLPRAPHTRNRPPYWHPPMVAYLP